jgi:hypothetical protein
MRRSSRTTNATAAAVDLPAAADPTDTGSTVNAEVERPAAPMIEKILVEPAFSRRAPERNR